MARRPITDWEAYNEKLRHLAGYDNKFMRRVTEEARRSPKRVVFGEANTDNILTAAVNAYHDGYAYPSCSATREMIEAGKRLGLDIEGIEIVNLRRPRPSAADSLPKLAASRQRRGITRPGLWNSCSTATTSA